MKLLYWDIDGTLLNTGHAGLNAIKEVLHDLKGEDTPVPKIDAGGRTGNHVGRRRQAITNIAKA